MPDPVTVRIGVSSCLLGQKVRFDGGHKRDAFLVDTFGQFVEWVPVCPEAEVGMGIPREPIRLQRVGPSVRLVGVKSATDHTDDMTRWAAKRVEALAREDLDGYILKKDSPSCGMERVKVYDVGGAPARTGRGAVRRGADRPSAAAAGRGRGAAVRPQAARQLRRARLRLPPAARACSTAAGRRARSWRSTPRTSSRCSRTRPTPTARSAASSRRPPALPRAEVKAEYESGFMNGLATMATPRKHVNVLQHMLGYFKRSLDDASRTELAGAIADYQQGLVPLIVPITLFRHHVRRCGVSYLAGADVPRTAPEGTDAAEPRVRARARIERSCQPRPVVPPLASSGGPHGRLAADDRPGWPGAGHAAGSPRRSGAAAEAAPWYREIGLNGLVSVSYVGNFNSPASGKNQFRVFDADNGTFKLDVAELDVQRAVSGAGDVGFRVDIAFGSISKVTAASGLFRDENGEAGDLDIHQAFLSYIAPAGRGLRFDAGKFTTHLGYEVIEGYDGFNDNQSHSFLFG